MDEFEDTNIHAPQELCAFPLWTCTPGLKGVRADGGFVLGLLSSTLPSLVGRRSPA
ncbi:hypothetical protein BDN71DRAFT_1453815 [Pleurotus eryngii]|uniref:Uncharacterized protein n=1 Tax=Pleurotus eryngii TaxID=5323 RepID=A0A9P5ZPJ9_PLEER|nr:hypothetical protein BDN71DRAFT_1453815 [Pleurotus eryngii]